jgi:hypothetical protein
MSEIVEADAVAFAGKAVRSCEPLPGLVDRENCPLRVKHGDIGRQHVDDAGVEAMVPTMFGATLMDRHESRSPSLARTIHEYLLRKYVCLGLTCEKPGGLRSQPTRDGIHE